MPSTSEAGRSVEVKTGTEYTESLSGRSVSQAYHTGKEEAQQLSHQFLLTPLQGSKHTPGQSTGKLFPNSLARDMVACDSGVSPTGVPCLEVGSQGHAHMVSGVCSHSIPGLQDPAYHIIWTPPLPTFHRLDQGCLYLFPSTPGPL